MKTNGLIYAALIVMLLCGVAVANENLTVIIDPPSDPSQDGVFLIGDTIRISGRNLISNMTYIRLTRDSQEKQFFRADVDNEGEWSYSFGKPLQHGAYSFLVSTPDSEEYVQSGFVLARKIITPTPTPDYNAKISVLEDKISVQETQIIIPTTIPTTEIITPEPTKTTDWNAKIAALETQLAEQREQVKAQKSIIDRILEFLGLK